MFISFVLHACIFVHELCHILHFLTIVKNRFATCKDDGFVMITKCLLKHRFYLNISAFIDPNILKD